MPDIYKKDIVQVFREKTRKTQEIMNSYKRKSRQQNGIMHKAVCFLFLLITANFATRQSIAMNIDIISSKNAENLSFFKTAALLIYSAVLKYLHLLFYKSVNFFFAFMRKKVNEMLSQKLMRLLGLTQINAVCKGVSHKYFRS